MSPAPVLSSMRLKAVRETPVRPVTVSQALQKQIDSPPPAAPARGTQRIATPPPLPTRRNTSSSSQEIPAVARQLPLDAQLDVMAQVPTPILEVGSDVGREPSQVPTPILEVGSDVGREPSLASSIEPALTSSASTRESAAEERPSSLAFLRRGISSLFAGQRAARRGISSLFAGQRAARLGIPVVGLTLLTVTGAVLMLRPGGLQQAAPSSSASPAEPGRTEPAPSTSGASVASTQEKVPLSDDGIPDYVSRPAVIHLTGIAIRRAQRCHPRGHAVGTARVFVTFAPNGTVSDARIDGEPLASAPVSRCILDHARSIRIARFNGEPFTYVPTVTLR